MKRIYTILTLLLCAIAVHSQDFKNGGVYYRILSEEEKCVEVTYNGDDYSSENEYSGNIIIPENVSLSLFEDWTSPDINDGETTETSYIITIEESTLLQFDWSVSSESNYDWLTITLDGEELVHASGSESGSYTKFIENAGTYTLVATYSKDVSASNGNDNGTISNITLNNTGTTYTVTSIGENAFRGCNELTEITIPATVTKIGNNAFNECYSIVKITLQGTTPPTIEDASVFTDEVYNYAYLSIPDNSEEAYRSAEGWANFQNYFSATCPWYYPIRTPNGGTKVKNNENGISVSQYYANTETFNLEKPTLGIRFTVLETNRNATVNGFPFFVLGEFRVLDADGNPIAYTVTSNADHNSLGYSQDGDGLPALNDGILNNYFHTVWSGNAPDEYHYIELTFEEAISTFSLEWYGRPNSSSNYEPTFSGITPRGYEFTTDMQYGKYEISVGESIAEAAEFDAEKDYAISSGSYDVYPTIKNNENITDFATEVGPQNIMQFIPTGNEAEFYIYNPINATVLTSDENSYNNICGNLKGSSSITNAQAVTLEKRNNGYFAITYQLSTGEKVWIGYDINGYWRMFPENIMQKLENNDYSSYYNAVDFNFTIYNIEVSGLQITRSSLAQIDEAKTAQEKNNLRQLVNESQTRYYTYQNELANGGYFTNGEDTALYNAIEEANAVIADSNATIATIHTVYSKLQSATIDFLMVKLNEINARNVAYFNDESLFCTTDDPLPDKYLEDSKSILLNGQSGYESYVQLHANGQITSIEYVISAITSLEGYITQFLKSSIQSLNFPLELDSSHGLPGEYYNNNIRWKSPIYTADEAVDGIRLTFTGSSSNSSINGYPLVSLAELHFFDADGQEIIYNSTNIKYNSLESSEGSIEGLYDNNYYSYYHSTWNSGLVNDDYVYLDITFPEPKKAFQMKILSNYNIRPSNIIVTPTGLDHNMNSNNEDSGENDDEEETISYTTVDVFSEPCLFVSLADGGVDAYPLASLNGDYSIEGDTLCIPLQSGAVAKYGSGQYTGISNEIPSLPHLTSYKFNNKYNANLNVDVEADSIDKNISLKLNAIGKWLTASFQLSDDNAIAYIGNKLQESKQTRNSFANPVTYSITYPGYNVIQEVEVDENSSGNDNEETGGDENEGEGEGEIEGGNGNGNEGGNEGGEGNEGNEDIEGAITTEILLTEDMLYTNKPSTAGDALGNMLDGSPSTIFHTAYGSSYDASVMPYITITLNEEIENVKFYYQARATGNYNPTQLNFYASSDGSSWELKREFSSSADNLPLAAGAEYTSPTIILDGSYRYFKLEQTASEYHNNHMVFAEFRMYKVQIPENIENNVESSNRRRSNEVNDSVNKVYKKIKVPFGRMYTVNAEWLADTARVARIDIDIEGGQMVTSKEVYLDAEFRITGYGMYEDFVDSVQIKGRGNTSWSSSASAKNPYRLKFDEKVKPFGLTKGKSWVLLANKQSGSMMANAVAMKVGQLVGAEYTNHIIPVELYINGNYRGSYMFTEKVGLANNSVDVDEEVGYMLELDTYYDEAYKFRSNKFSLPVNIKEPDLSEFDNTYAQSRKNEIQADFNRAENAVYTGTDIGHYIDLDAAARFLLANELVMNMEIGHPKSTFLFKEDLSSSESKIKFGPLWDFDWAFGYENTSNYFTVPVTTGLFSKISGYGATFFKALMNNREFKRHYYKVWKEFLDNNHIEEIKDYIKEYYEFVEESFQHNSTKWGDGNGYGSKLSTMQQWMENRQNFIAKNLTKYDISDLVHALLGDIDCNDAVTIRDIALLNSYLAGITDDDFNLAKADTDNNGTVDAADLPALAMAIATSDPVSSLYRYNTPQSNAMLVAGNIEAMPGEATTSRISLAGGENIKALQADIKVPFGVEVEDITAENGDGSTSLLYVQLTEELFRVVAYRTDSTAFANGSTLFNISLCSYTAEPNDTYDITISNILAADTANIEQKLDDTQFAMNFNRNGHKLTYIVDGEIYKTVYLEEGTTIEPIAAPEKQGYTFDGWEGLPQTMPAEDTTVTALFTVNSYNVTFIVDGETYHTATVEFGAQIELPTEPEKEGYTFDGWEGLPQTMPAEDITVTALFTVNSYSVMFIVDGETYHTATVEFGAQIELPAPPEKEGYTFDGWEGLPQTMPAEDITVTALFTINSYNVTFIVDGETYHTATVEFGAQIELPTEPEKEGYTFNGWEGLPQTMPAEDITVTALFTANTGLENIEDSEEMIVYDLNGQRILDTENLKQGIYIINGKKVRIK